MAKAKPSAIWTKISKIFGKVGMQFADAPAEAVGTAIGFATSSAIQAPMKPLQYKLNKQFPYELLAVFDLQTLLNRGEINEAYFTEELSKFGYNAEKIDKLKKLAGAIPSVSDFIRFAVREVFSPGTAAKYGQFEDYPAQLDEMAKKSGLDPSYAKYYWAAHWELPSFTQGSEMYHRGIISYEDLELLLKSLDVMPYWRDKMIKLSQSPFTRVDVRRMYKSGVLSFDEVVKAYMDLGYDKDKAKKLADFTASSGASTTKDLTKAEYLSAYGDALISKGELTQALAALGYDSTEISLLVELQETKKTRKYLNQYISALKREFLNGRLDAARARSELAKLSLGGDDIEELLAAWTLELEPKTTLPTKAEVVKWYAVKVITYDEAAQVLEAHGYAEKWIKLYLSEGTAKE